MQALRPLRRAGSFFLLSFTAAIAQAPPEAVGDQGLGRPDGIAAAARAIGRCGTGRLDGAAWGIAPRCQLRATADSVRFTPELGPAAPGSLPIELRFESAGRDGTALDAAIAVEPDAAGTTIRYVRGAIEERYEMRPDGVEQSFVFAERPTGRGDLVVVMRLATQLDPAPADGGGVVFGRGGAVIVTMGAVTGIDRDGATARGRIRIRGDRIELALPAAFVDAARYPMVLDPLLGTASVPTGTGDDGEPDVSFDGSTATWLAVWRRTLSATETSLLGLRLDDTGQPIGAVFPIAAGPGAVRMRPRVANLGATNRFLVVWQQAASIVGPFDVRGTAVTTGGAVLAEIGIATTAADETAPCVGGNGLGAGANPNDALVCWQRDGEAVEARIVSGAPVAGPGPIVLAATGAARPAVSRSLGSNTLRWLVAFEQTAGAGTDREIAITAVSGTPQASGVPVSITVNADDDLEPAVDGLGGSFLIAWTRVTGANRRIVCRRATVVAGAPGGAGAELPMPDDPAAADQRPDVAQLDSTFVVTWERVLSALASDAFAQIVVPSPERCGPALSLAGPARSGSYDRQARPRACGRRNGLAGADGGFVVFAEGQSVLPLDQDVVVQGIASMGAGGPVTITPTLCGTTGTVSVVGPCALGNGGFAFKLTNADPGAFCFTNVNFGVPSSQCGLCALLPFGIVEFTPVTGTEALRSLPLPCDESFLGVPLAAQFLLFGGTVTACPAVAGLEASARIDATIGL
jgi:hypothetical protein